jgi:ribose transport system ATP-binding protein
MSAAPADQTQSLTLKNFSVAFGETRALDDVSFQIMPGQVHGLVGQNGSGKSTLIKVLAGYYAPEPGAVLQVGNQSVNFPISRSALQGYGMAFVHQDLGLIPQLSVLENFLIGQLSSKNQRWINWSREKERVNLTFEKFQLHHLDLMAKVGSLSLAQQAMLAIVRALEEVTGHRGEGELGGGLLVLDEPTAYLPEEEKEHLFQLVRDVVATGQSVLFVSHYLEEVLEITSHVSVLRDGRVVGDFSSKDLTTDRLVELIIGRTLEGGAVSTALSNSGKMGLQVTELAGGLVDGVDLHILEGEIVGLTGLLGSGFEDVPSLIFGSKKAERGKVQVGGSEYSLKTMHPVRAIDAGIVLIPADRQHDGLSLSLSILDNVTLQLLAQHRNKFGLSRSKMLRTTERLMDDFDVRPRDPLRKVSELSGGNQQKVLMAKWLASNPRVVLLDEPTRGVDVGSRKDILQKIRVAAVRDGLSVLCVSSEPDQLVELCDRVLVMGGGRVVSELTLSELTKDRIVERCYSAAATHAV